MASHSAWQRRIALLALLLAAPLAGVANIPAVKFTELPRSDLGSELRPILQRAALDAPTPDPIVELAHVPEDARRIERRPDARMDH